MVFRKVDPKLAKAIEEDMADIDGKAEEPKKTVQVEATETSVDGICPTCNNTGLDSTSAQAGLCPTCNGHGGGERTEVSVDRESVEG